VNPAGEAQQETPISQPEPKLKTRQSAIDLLERVVEQPIRNQIISAEIARELFDQDWRLARVFQMSGQFNDLKKLTPEQGIATAMAKIRIGRGWGLNETEAMTMVVFINGIPTLQNEIIASRLMDAGYYWDLTFEEKQVSGGVETTGCIFLPKFRTAPDKEYKPILDGTGKPARIHFGHFEASTTLIWEDGKQKALSEKWNYRAYPRSMYFWRCIAMFKRQYATNILSAARMPFEAEESLDAVVEETERRGMVQGSRAAQKDMAEAMLKIHALIKEGKFDEARAAAEAGKIDFKQFEASVEIAKKKQTSSLDTKPSASGPVASSAPPVAGDKTGTGNQHAIDSKVDSGRGILERDGGEFRSDRPSTAEPSDKPTDPLPPDMDAMRLDQQQSLAAYEEKFKAARKPARFWDILMTNLGTNDISKAPWEQSYFMGAVRALEAELATAKAAAPGGEPKLEFGKKPGK
jgi:hypothetical protein